MKLIDVDTLDDYLGKWADDFYENPENSDADFMDGYCMTLNRIHSGAVPEVGAIPIEWINHYMDTELTKGTLFYSCMREFMRDWKTEQEKADKKKSHFPKGFFSKERPLAKGEDDETD